MNQPHTPSGPPWTLSQLAALTAQTAAAVPGVVRLQPSRIGPTTAVRTMIASTALARPHPPAAVEVTLTPHPQVTLRITTSTTFPPAAVAAQLQARVTQALHQRCGLSFTVLVMITDISPADQQ